MGEFAKEYASKGVAGAGLGTGIAGLALGVANSGGLLGGMFGRNGNWGWNNYNNGCGGYDLVRLLQCDAEKDAEIGMLRAQRYSDQNGLELYKYFDGKIGELRDLVAERFAQQGIYNATMTNTASTMANQIQVLQGLVGSITRTVIPQSKVVDFNCCGGNNAVTQ